MDLSPHFLDLYTSQTRSPWSRALKSITKKLKPYIWISSCKSSETTLPSLKPILWAKDKVYALGVWFSTLEDTPANVNFSEKIDRFQSILNSWSARRLTLLGKITVIKSLAVSQIVYLLSSLPSHQKVVHEINSILYDFLWDKGDTIRAD